MLCVCHGEPAYWQKDTRTCRAGGYWRCSVKHREKALARYDRDPVHRIGKQLHDQARKRRATLTRRRATLGALQIEG